MQSIAENLLYSRSAICKKDAMDARQPLHAILKFRRDSIFIRLAGGGRGGGRHIACFLARIHVSFDELVNKCECFTISHIYIHLIDPIDVVTNE